MSPNMKMVKTLGHWNWTPLQMSSAIERDASRICTVLSCILEHLGLEDIKNCRRVCHKWNFVAESFIPKLASVHFRIGSLSPAHFMRDFAHLNFSAFTFSSYRFGNDEWVQMFSWPVTEIEEFFKSDWGQNIKTLKLRELTLKNRKGQIIADFNLESLLKPLIKLSELTVDFPPKIFRSSSAPTATTNFIVPLDKLTSLKVIQLKNCDIALPAVENAKSFSKITPVKISLIDVRFFNKENPAWNVIVNDFVDFSKATEITVCEKKQTSNRGTSPVIKLTSEISNVRKLTLSGCKFDRKIDIPIKQIVFEDAIIDLSVLPQTIEKIHFKYNVRFINDRPLPSNYFPNLNFVAIERAAFQDNEVDYGVRSFKSACSYLQSRSLKHIRLESNLSKRHIGPFLEDEHRQQFPQEIDSTMILYKPSDTLPYKLNASFGQSLKQGMFSME